jgi:hypothetical protein
MLSETRTSIQGGEERRMISSSVSSKANVDHHTYTQQSFLLPLLTYSKTEDNSVREQIRLFDC